MLKSKTYAATTIISLIFIGSLSYKQILLRSHRVDGITKAWILPFG